MSDGVDLSQLRPGDVVRFADGSLGLVWDTSDSWVGAGYLTISYAKHAQERSIWDIRGRCNTISTSFDRDGKRVYPNGVGDIVEIIRGKRDE